MQRYYFNIEGNGVEIVDTKGVVLPPSPDIIEALGALIAEVAIEEDWLDDLNAHYQMRVADHTGNTVVVVPLDRTTGGNEWMWSGDRCAMFAD